MQVFKLASEHDMYDRRKGTLPEQMAGIQLFATLEAAKQTVDDMHCCPEAREDVATQENGEELLLISWSQPRSNVWIGVNNATNEGYYRIELVEVV